MDEVGLDEMDMDEVGMDEVGLDEQGMDELGMDELGLDELGVDEVGVDELAHGRSGVDEVAVPRPHLHISELKSPTPVRSLLSLTQACCGRSDPGLLLVGEEIYSRSRLVNGCHSTDHILATQWAFVSLSRVVDRRSLALVAKGRRDFSLGCVSSLVMM